MDPAWIALIGTVFGGVGLKVIERWLSKTERESAGRRDLLTEVSDLQKRIDLLEEEVTAWRNRYYEEQEKVAMLRVQAINAGLLPADLAKPPDA